MQEQNMDNLPKIPIIWLASENGGKIINTIFSPKARSKVDEILRLTMEGHENIYEPFDNLFYLGEASKNPHLF